MISNQELFDIEQLNLESVVQKATTVPGGVALLPRIYHGQSYQATFMGKDLVKWLKGNQFASTEPESIEICQELQNEQLIFSINLMTSNRIPQFAPSHIFTFEYPMPNKIEQVPTWRVMMEDDIDAKNIPYSGEQLVKSLDGKSDIKEKFGEQKDGGLNAPHLAEMLFEESNCELYDAVRPIKWDDPEQGNEPYDILVIGGGAGGLVTAAQSKGLGARVCLIERQFLGGDCLNNGCVPSKAFLKSCSVAHSAKNAGNYGIIIKGPIEIDFPAIMERMRQIRAEIAENDSAQRFSKYLGVDLYLGHAKFTGANTAEVNGKALTFKKACIATGGRPKIPEVPGIDKITYHTSESIFNLNVLPKSMIILGCGPIGCELGQGFARLGTEVTMFEIGSQFLPREDRDCSAYLQQQMVKDGVSFHFVTEPVSFELLKKAEDNEGHQVVKHEYRNINTQKTGIIEAEVVLIAAGRLPNVEGLALETAGVEFDKFGVKVNKNLQTTNENIYAVGDCLPGAKFTHNSDVHARYVIRNALLSDKKSTDDIILPATTYTDPEIASVGMNEVRLKNQGIEFETYTKFFDKCDRAICESRNGIYKVYCRKGTDEILGATLVGGPAGDMLSQITSAMVNGIGLGKLGDSIYPYPTYAESFGHLSNFQYRPRYKLGPATNGIREGMKEYKE